MTKVINAIMIFIFLGVVISFSGCVEKNIFEQKALIHIEIRQIEDMEYAFLSLNPQGVKSDFNPSQELFDFSQLVFNVNHLQGMAVYGDYIITNLNGHYNITSVGYIYVYDSEGIIQHISTPEPTIGNDLTHTSGMQVIGDYLFVMMSGEDGEPNHMLIYYLKGLNEGGKVTLFQSIIVEDFSSASIGGTVFTDSKNKEAIVVCDKDRNLLKSYLGGESFIWHRMDKHKNSFAGKSSELNNVAMFTDVNNVMWILGMESDTVGSGLRTKYTNVLNLYRVDFMEDGSYKVSEALHSLSCTPFDTESFLGSHFRFGATAVVNEENEFIVYSTPSFCLNRLSINVYQPFRDN